MQNIKLRGPFNLAVFRFEIAFLVLTFNLNKVSMVADELLRRKNEGRGASWSDFAVLYRTNATGLLFQETFRKRGIPFKVQVKVRGEHPHDIII